MIKIIKILIIYSDKLVLLTDLRLEWDFGLRVVGLEVMKFFFQKWYFVDIVWIVFLHSDTGGQPLVFIKQLLDLLFLLVKTFLQSSYFILLFLNKDFKGLAICFDFLFDVDNWLAGGLSDSWLFINDSRMARLCFHQCVVRGVSVVGGLHCCWCSWYQVRLLIHHLLCLSISY